MRPLYLVAGYVGIMLLPLILAWIGGRPPRGFWDELASGAGLLAFAVILVEFVLSGRFRFVSGRIGMDVTMRFHQLLARTAVVFALVHPFLYSTPMSPQRPWDVSRQLTLQFDLGTLSTGILAWILLPAFALLSIGRDKIPYSYEVWRAMHATGAIIIAALMLHHTLAAGRYSQEPVLAWFWIVLFIVAVWTMAYVYAVEPLWQRSRPWIVESVRPLALRTWELTLAPDQHQGIAYQAGQFLWLNVGHSSFSIRENPFSISSAPVSGPKLQFVIKELGDFTNVIGQVKSGTKAYIDGPHGNLTVANRNEPGIALIAGGVGIAPLIGILRQLQIEGDTRPTTLVYGNRVKEQIVYADEIDQLSRQHGTSVIHVLSEPAPSWTGRTGLVGTELIRDVFGKPDSQKWLYILCGPAEMMEIVEDTLVDMGVPSNQILSERFKYD